MKFKKIYVIYSEQDRELVKKLIVDLKAVGIIIIRAEMEPHQDAIKEFIDRNMTQNTYIILVNSKLHSNTTNTYENKKNMIFLTNSDMAEQYSTDYNLLLHKIFKHEAEKLQELLKIKEISSIDERLDALEVHKGSYGEGIAYATIKANAIYRQKKFKEARQIIDDALTFDFDNPVDNFEYASLLEEYYGQYSMARKHYEIAIHQKPNYEQAIFSLAIMLTNTFKDYQKAVDCYDKLIEMTTKDARVYFNKAIIMISQFGNIDVAKTLYEKAIEIDKEYVKAYNNLANIYLKEYNNAEKAKYYYEKAIEVCDTDFSIYFNLANIYKNSFKDYEKARELYQKSIDCEENIYARMNLALLLEEQYRDYQRALENLLKILDDQPNNLTVLNELVKIYEYHIVNIDEAIKYQERICVALPDNEEIKYNFARLKHKNKK